MYETDLVSLATIAATNAGINPAIFMGLVKQESGWNPAARSGAGAIGLAQIMPIWTTPNYAKTLGMEGITTASLLDPMTNLTAGARIMAEELKRFGSNELALMAYNAGAGAVTKAIERAGTRNPATVSKYLASAETRGYWQKVMAWAKDYADGSLGISTELENIGIDVSERSKDFGGIAPIMLALLGAAAIFLLVKK